MPVVDQSKALKRSKMIEQLCFELGIGMTVLIFPRKSGRG